MQILVRPGRRKPPIPLEVEVTDTIEDVKTKFHNLPLESFVSPEDNLTRPDCLLIESSNERLHVDTYTRTVGSCNIRDGTILIAIAAPRPTSKGSKGRNAAGIGARQSDPNLDCWKGGASGGADSSWTGRLGKQFKSAHDSLGSDYLSPGSVLPSPDWILEDPSIIKCAPHQVITRFAR
jgi:hypothetical protein